VEADGEYTLILNIKTDAKDFTPKKTGVLLLNVNLPADTKAIGKLRGTISGHIKTLPPELRR